MLRNWLSKMRTYLIYSCAALLAAAGVSRAEQALPPADAPKVAAAAPAAAVAPAAAAQPAAPMDVQAQLQSQQKRSEDLENLIRSGQLKANSAEADAGDGADKKDAPKPISEADVKKIVGDYLKENPGANLSNGVQTGFEGGKGFVIRSAPDPKWTNWDDGSKIPFELRIRGRLQADYYFYKETDRINHQTGQFNTPTGTNKGAPDSPDFSQLEIKRVRLIFEGTAFDPNLRYHLELDGNTRGLGGVAGGNLPGNAGTAAPGTTGVPDGNTITTVDHAVRLFSAYVAYDWHPCGYEKGCGPDCPDGMYRYTPTITGIVGKIKPMVAFEEYLGSGNEQFVEYGMTNWFFDADDDNLLMAAGTQIKAFDDRLYVQALVTNGNESQFPNGQMDDYPGINVGGWWDFGGSWNDARKKWDLFGDCLSDIDYSCCPVLRVGAAANLVPMDRHSLYANDELSRIRVMPAAPGGTTLLSMLNGGGVLPNAAGVGQFAIDKADEYTFDVYAAAKYHGFSIYNEWWFEDIADITGRKGPAGAYPGNGINQPILYTSTIGAPGTTQVSLFPRHNLIAYGSQVQGGYFVVPKKLELCARVSWIRGSSGDINGNGTLGAPLTAAQKAALGIPAATVVNQVNSAFNVEKSAYEYALGVNYYFYRQLVKWQTDVSVYQGGNPASGGQSPAGFIPGVDGWMLRTQLQFAF